MAKRVVKTIKRDYATLVLRPDAAIVMQQLGSWFEHDNTKHPHSALHNMPRGCLDKCRLHTAEPSGTAIQGRDHSTIIYISPVQFETYDALKERFQKKHCFSQVHLVATDDLSIDDVAPEMKLAILFEKEKNAALC